MKLYNYHLSKARQIVENAFGRMKARFRYCMKRLECKLDTAEAVMRACCVLNNICDENSEYIISGGKQRYKETCTLLQSCNLTTNTFTVIPGSVVECAASATST